MAAAVDQILLLVVLMDPAEVVLVLFMIEIMYH